MDENQSGESIRLTLRVKSHAPDRSSEKLVEEISLRQPQLLSVLKTNLTDAKAKHVTVIRDQAFGIGADAIQVAIIVGIVTGLGEAVGKRVGETVLDWINSEFFDVEVIQLNLETQSN